MSGMWVSKTRLGHECGLPFAWPWRMGWVWRCGRCGQQWRLDAELFWDRVL